MAESSQENPLQGYFEWQVTTLLLAYDLVDPLDRDTPEAAENRRRRTEEEVSQLSLAVIPDQYQQNPDLDWPPEVMMNLTRATFQRVNQILENTYHPDGSSQGRL